MGESDRQENTAVEKASFMRQFEDLRPDFFFPEAWTNDQRSEVLAEVSASRTKTNMYAAIPMNCRAKKCVYANSCPLLAKNLAPEGKPCPIEMAMVAQFAAGLMEELNVDPNNLVEVSMVRDLVDQEVQTLRSSKLLSQEDMIQENVIGIDDRGNPILQKDLHKAVELQDRILKRKKDLRNQLMATREKKAQIGMGRVDSAIVLSNIVQEVRELEQQQEDKLRKKLGLVYEDEYIKADRVAREKDIVDAEIIEEKLEDDES